MVGVDVNAEYKYGYVLSSKDIPDFKSRVDSGFSDLADDSGGWTVTVCGDKMFCDSLIVGDNTYASYDEQNLYIGVDLPNEATPDEIVDECRKSYEKTRRMYELVMRRPPTDEPKIYVFARWW